MTLLPVYPHAFITFLRSGLYKVEEVEPHSTFQLNLLYTTQEAKAPPDSTHYRIFWLHLHYTI